MYKAGEGWRLVGFRDESEAMVWGLRACVGLIKGLVRGRAKQGAGLA